jgi:hypothetical protein
MAAMGYLLAAAFMVVLSVDFRVPVFVPITNANRDKRNLKLFFVLVRANTVKSMGEVLPEKKPGRKPGSTG